MGAITLSHPPLRIDVDHLIDEVGPSCVLYLPFYKLPGSNFDSRDNNQRRCVSVGSLWTPQGRRFDGIDDTVTVTTPPAVFNGDADYSFILWVKWNALDDSLVARSYTVAIPTLAIGLTNDKGGGVNTIKFFTYLNGSSEYLIADSGMVPALGTWYHVAATFFMHATFTSRVQKIYVNGILKATKSPVIIGGTVQGGTPNLIFGELTSYFSGFLGEVLVYQRLLENSEIRNHYLATKGRYQ